MELETYAPGVPATCGWPDPGQPHLPGIPPLPRSGEDVRSLWEFLEVVGIFICMLGFLIGALIAICLVWLAGGYRSRRG
jgi:hypothetical protein